MEYSRLNKNSKKSWFIARFITTIIMTIIFLVGKFFLINKAKVEWVINGSTYINIVGGIILLLLLLNTLVYPIIEYKQWKYTITKDKIEFVEGIYFTTKTIIPIVRVQHTKVTQGPINKMFKLASVQIYTAGGSHTIPNIEIEKAEEISEFLKNKVKEKVEEND